MPAAIDTCLCGRRRARLPGPAPHRHAERVAASWRTRWPRSAAAPSTCTTPRAPAAATRRTSSAWRARCNCLPSSTNPTNPYTVNTFDEHLDMTMVCHHLNPAIPEDVAFAESRIRAQTIAAEDVLHDMGAISMLGSDSQGMGRIDEVICRTWQLASKMKDQRGRAAGGEDRASATMSASSATSPSTPSTPRAPSASTPSSARSSTARWPTSCSGGPAFFGIKPELVVKGGFIAWGAMGDSAASLMTCEPLLHAPAMGRVRQGQAGAVGLLRQPARDRGATSRARSAFPRRCCRRAARASSARRDMLHNDACPRSRSIRRPSTSSSTACSPPASRRTSCRWRSATCCDDRHEARRQKRAAPPAVGRAHRHRRSGRAPARRR